MIKVFAAFGFILIIASCDEEALATLSGKWRLAHYFTVQPGAQGNAALSPGGSIVLTFSDDGRTGTIAEDTAMGQIMGIYEIGPRNRFSFTSFPENLSSNEWSSAVLSRISRADFVKISESTLSISCDEGREVLLFVRDN